MCRTIKTSWKQGQRLSDIVNWHQPDPDQVDLFNQETAGTTHFGKYFLWGNTCNQAFCNIIHYNTTLTVWCFS